ncbi:hypothetical protein HRR83_002285 [Exophiala dermatitidis]|uniref:Uncharacterized protein n=1 Tax=Exophiala dermatitidis TaxID=5970 RepID=A0AAN6IZJ7_EXODE|nr:hypothetical protein HRR74_002362 [Exophiala dermatitidis]KAJ4525563.1 hypothetical protein HRR73_002293 [Exophiala dermatitidis]KAJ4536880.1 hypothetical protein HRR76_004906 [Exophiala dermatitidis]KAJ4555519.1 hypothetical protein HRR77_001449 [Exophiala dermatitidis]KAJ4568823.1 hypothetical protein HRR81_006480 [Exophiala dermatitidis]
MLQNVLEKILMVAEWSSFQSRPTGTSLSASFCPRICRRTPSHTEQSTRLAALATRQGWISKQLQDPQDVTFHVVVPPGPKQWNVLATVLVRRHPKTRGND